MKQCEYLEGEQAQENFEEGMKTLFKIPKDEAVAVEKKLKGKRRSSRAQSVRKPRAPDKD